MNKNVILLVLGLMLLTATAVLNTRGFVFDERLFPPNVELMERLGFGKQFLLQMKDQAPGPLYEFVHYPLKGLTNLSPQGLRTVNIILFYLVIVIVAYTYKQWANESFINALYFSLHIMGISLLWQVAGLALTEIPAMAMVCVSFYFGMLILQEGDQTSAGKRLLLSIAMGIAGGLAILGRTPYLVMIPAFFCVLFIQRFYQLKKNYFGISFFPYALIALAMVIPIFIIWGGLVPPLQPRVDAGIEPWHGLLALAYAGVIALIINPRFFVFNNTILIIILASYTVFLIFNLLGVGFEYSPMAATVARVIGLMFLNIYTMLVSPLLATFGFYFLVCCFIRGKENIDNPVYLFALLTALAILATSAKISHQFSSRYVAQAAPFLVLILTNIKQEDKWKWARLIVGMAMGFLSLNTYAKFL